MVSTAFVTHMAEHGLSYGTIEEFNFRANLYSIADQEINAHNNSNSTYTLGHNFMSSWTAAERKRLNGYVASTIPEPQCVAEAGSCSAWDQSKQCCPGTECYLETACMKVSTSNAAAEVNWVTAGAVTPVKNQGQCGSCWSFSTTGALEGAHQIASGQLASFSEEQLVECSRLNHGCNGGSMALAFRYYKTHFAELESAYPYSSGTGKKGSCKYDSTSKTAVEVSKFAMITPNSPDALKAAIAKGPVSVAIEADKPAFQKYVSGVITGSACGTKLDHGVLAVGYGTENGVEYYLVKNSWGPTWGAAGYVKIGIEAGKGVCGIQEQPVQPTAN